MSDVTGFNLLRRRQAEAEAATKAKLNIISTAAEFEVPPSAEPEEEPVKINKKPKRNKEEK